MMQRALIVGFLLVLGCSSTPENETNIGAVERREEPEYQSMQNGPQQGVVSQRNTHQVRTLQTDAARRAMEKKNQGDPQQKVKASSKIADYDGKARVERVGPSRQETLKQRYEQYREMKNKAEENIKKMRVLVYCTEGRQMDSRSGGSGVNRPRAISRKAPRALVLVDGDAYDFKLAYKSSDYSKLRGTVKPVSKQRFDAVLRDLESIGLTRLRNENSTVGGNKISHERAIHIDVKGKRISYIKSDQMSNGTMDSQRAIFTRCEHALIQLFAPSARGNVDNSKS